jgi:tRNA threonylcarbamoyladenosine biosynthesis protein TsaB
MQGFNCIAIETSTQQGSVAACYNGGHVALSLDDGQSSSRQIYQLIRKLLTELNATVADFDCIAFGCGPGSFTGVRIAASAAQALAYAGALPVCRVSTLAALAAPLLDTSERVAVCLDARMGEAFTGIYSRDDSGAVVHELEDCLVKPGQFRLVDHAPDALAAGPGWQVWNEMLSGFNGDVRAECRPDAAAVMQLAGRMYADGETIVAAAALPNYVRNQVTQQAKTDD